MYLTPYIPQIRKLCEQHRVERLYAFGSALTDRFSDDSDVDFLYTFKDDIPLLEIVDCYFNLQNDLEQTLQRPIDLTSEKALRNPYFIQEVNATKQLIYG
ncbi:MAG: nucleotidyltransferase domain-containing protein [Tannerella sp.]|jgi:predicted nucleotidyltransferase|nr:nucleotidyltransferase domain-containing protein [Tannerella sp.]